MKNLSYARISQSREYLSPLGDIHWHTLFGGYGLTVENTVFAIVAGGELYLRACEQSTQYCVHNSPPLLTFTKRGRPVLLNYYRVDDHLWNDRDKLLWLSFHALEAARREKLRRSANNRLKDLPNLTFHLELLLIEAGVNSEEILQMLGAKVCWLKLRQLKKDLSGKVLFALEGAIAGRHEAALPADKRQELTEWLNSLPDRQQCYSVR